MQAKALAEAVEKFDEYSPGRVDCCHSDGIKRFPDSFLAVMTHFNEVCWKNLVGCLKRFSVISHIIQVIHHDVRASDLQCSFLTFSAHSPSAFAFVLFDHERTW